MTALEDKKATPANSSRLANSADFACFSVTCQAHRESTLHEGTSTL